MMDRAAVLLLASRMVPTGIGTWFCRFSATISGVLTEFRIESEPRTCMESKEKSVDRGRSRLRSGRGPL